MLPYFPFDQDVFALRLGVRALRADEPLIEVDVPHYAGELALKARLLAEPRLRFGALPGSEAAQWEAVRLVLPLMAREHPHHFALETRPDGPWHWVNHLLGTEARFTPGDAGGLPHAPLDWLGRQVQEDLALMDGTREGLPLIAGHLCFPAGWCLEDKLGLPLLDVHAPVPDFNAKIGPSTAKLLQGLKPGRPVTRVNWGISATDRLDLAPWTRGEWLHLREGITAENAGARCFMRLERQTLSALPETGAVLFTIHTYVGPVGAEVEDPERRRRLAGVVRTLPPDMAAYKGMAAFLPGLLAYLDGPTAG